MTVTAMLELRIKPDALESAHPLIKGVLADTRAFDGCLGVDVLVDIADPAHITVVETWASPEQDAAYRQWRTTPAGQSDLGTILAGAPVLTLFTTAYST